MASLPIRRYTPEQYLRIERSAEYKSEYIAGEMFAMSGASRLHNVIAFNIAGSLHPQLKGRPCEAYLGDMRVNVGSAFLYPDVVVACGKIEMLDDYVDTLLNPTVIVEVLSKSTEAYDRGEKFARYWQIASLTDYLLVSQDRMRVEHFIRQTNSEWLLSARTDQTGVVPLASIGCELRLSDIYDKTDLSGKPQ